jgi:hypothetical protein
MMLLWLWLRLRPQSFGLLSCYTEAKNFKVSALYAVYFAQYRPKDRGRSRSRIIFPCWSQIKMIWVRLQLQLRLRPLSYAYLFCYQSKKVQYNCILHNQRKVGGAGAGDGAASFSHSGAASQWFVSGSGSVPRSFGLVCNYSKEVRNIRNILHNISLWIGVGASAGAASFCNCGAASKWCGSGSGSDPHLLAYLLLWQKY